MNRFFRKKKLSVKLQPHVGLDLGTTKSSICFIVGNQPKEPTFVPLGHLGRISIPSLVSFSKEANSAFPAYTPDFGLKAKYLAYADEAGLEKEAGKVECTFSQSKLHVGQGGFARNGIPLHPAMEKSLPDFPEVTPEIVLAHIMRYLKKELEKHLRTISRDYETYNCEDITITVPANWNPEQRRATAFAAKLAGFKNDVELLDEPISALIALRERNSFGITKEAENVMVIDFGGGTCDICLLRVKEKHITLLDARAKYIGGETIDAALFSRYLSQLKIGIQEIPEDVLILKILPAVTSFKENINNEMDGVLLSDPAATKKYMDKKYQFRGGYSQYIQRAPDRSSVAFKMSYRDFDELTSDIRENFTNLLSGAQNVAKGYGGVQRLFVVGGSSHLYFVKPIVQLIFENLGWRETIQRPDLPERYVALGAAWYQYARDHRKDIFDHKIFYNIGLHIPDGGQSENLVKSGGKLPCKEDRLITLKEGSVPTNKLTLRFQRDDAIAKGDIVKDIIARNRAITPADKLRIFVQVKRDGIVDIAAKDNSYGTNPLVLETEETYPLGRKIDLVSQELTKSFPFIRNPKESE